LSVFLPVPTLVTIDKNQVEKLISVEYLALISLLLFKAVVLTQIYENRKSIRYDFKLIFALMFYILYKLGLATSIAVFSLRANLPCLLMLVIFFYKLPLPRHWKPVITLITLGLIASIGFTYIRLDARGIV